MYSQLFTVTIASVCGIVLYSESPLIKNNIIVNSELTNNQPTSRYKVRGTHCQIFMIRLWADHGHAVVPFSVALLQLGHISSVVHHSNNISNSEHCRLNLRNGGTKLIAGREVILSCQSIYLILH